MNKVELEIVALSHSITQTHSYAVVLGEVNGLRRLPIVIGGFEAQAIAVALERMQPSRPLTHDLMKNFMNAFNVELSEVIINDLQEGIFYSKLICIGENETIELDSRTSDAIAMAVRFGCPIYTYENILENAGVQLNEEESTNIEINDDDFEDEENTIEDDITIPNSKAELASLTLEELENRLNEILEKEDYMTAILIRDEINRRK